MLTSNTILQNRYRVIRELGHGGMGTVYEVLDQRVSCIVALKETSAGNNREARSAFEREAALLANLRHSALPKVMDYFSEGGSDFLVMEFIPGYDLSELLELRGGPFPQAQVLRWADALLQVLEYLHRQQPAILHRDIKPSNLKLTKQGEIFLLDFGLAKGAAGQMPTLMTSRSVKGYTPVYASIEQILGQGTDPRSDLYSLAATLHHLLTALPPKDAPMRFDALEDEQPDPLPAIEEVNPQISANVAAVIRKTMAINRRQRPASAVEMRKALRHAIEEDERHSAEEEYRRAEVRGQQREDERRSEAAELEREEERQTLEAETRRKKEALRLAVEAEARRNADEEAAQVEEETRRRVAEEKLRKMAEQDARRLAEQEALRLADEEQRRLAVETRRKTDEEAVRHVEEETRRRGIEGHSAAIKAPESIIKDETEGEEAKDRKRRIQELRAKLGEEKSIRKRVALTMVGVLAIVVVGVIVIGGMVLRPWGSGVVTGDSGAVGDGGSSNVSRQQPAPGSQSDTKSGAANVSAPTGMVYVPGGTFTMGRDVGDEGERPAHQVTVKPFFSDTYEVTNEDYGKFVKATGHRAPATWKKESFPSGASRKPVTGVTWDDANDYGRWAGKRLPTEEEWEFAARGTDARLYPWGNNWRQGSANANGAEQSMSDVGAYKGTSPFGAYDMIGNAWEWTASDFRAYSGGRLPANQPSGELKTIRGGSYESTKDYGTTTYRVGWPANYASASSQTGFRCVKDIEKQ